MLNFNQLKALLRDFFEQHLQINEFVFANESEFLGKREKQYPAANVSYLNSTITGKKINHSFRVLICSMPQEQSEDEVINDSLLIAEDLFSFLQYKEGFEFAKSSTLQPFSEYDGDRVSGVTFTIVLSLIRTQNDCAIPSKNEKTGFPYNLKTPFSQ